MPGHLKPSYYSATLSSFKCLIGVKRACLGAGEPMSSLELGRPSSFAYCVHFPTFVADGPHCLGVVTRSSVRWNRVPVSQVLSI